MKDDDEKLLRDINVAIGFEEHSGEWGSLARRIATQPLRMGGEAPVLAFRRASGECLDARSYLDSVGKSAERVTSISSVELVGDCRAIVRCVVAMNGKRFDNLRIFVRSSATNCDWRLLAWANEELPGDAPKT